MNQCYFIWHSTLYLFLTSLKAALFADFEVCSCGGLLGLRSRWWTPLTWWRPRDMNILNTMVVVDVIVQMLFEHTNKQTNKQFNLRTIIRHELYYYDPRSENLQVTRMRIQYSSFNAHLCFSLHLVGDAKFSCVFAEEDPNQIFFSCPQYAQQRKTLCQSLDLTTITTQDILFGTDTHSL